VNVMKFVVFGGTPGSGKTSVLKHVVEELSGFSIHYVKFDVLATDDPKLMRGFVASTEKFIAGDLCPDHYAALIFPKIVEEHGDKDIVIVETAGLCLRCSPYTDNGLGVNIMNITAGKPSSYGPLLTHADVVAVNKGDLVSQAEREIFRTRLLKVNKKAEIVETNGLTGEGAVDMAELIRETPETKGKLRLKHSMPSAICGYCYGNLVVDDKEAHERYVKASELKSLIPNLNCGACGYKSCNEFIRAVLDGETKKEVCIYLKGEDS
jgi:Ni2+-binding GTPase involved in maturation of urease and hydrogenase